MTLLYSLLALLGGALFPLQTAVNAQLGRSVGGALVATIISFCVGLVALLAILLVTTRQFPDLGMLKSIPAYLYVGGLLGATFLGLSVFLTPRIGSGTMMCLAIAGQILTSMTIDYFGWFGLPVREVSLVRMAGAALVAAGVALVRFY